ncbi:Adenylosuccinate lyase [Nymphaea thermarum]|nr:Adenylosuccinate lyase [Nymphaea thermarum]
MTWPHSAAVRGSSKREGNSVSGAPFSLSGDCRLRIFFKLNKEKIVLKKVSLVHNDNLGLSSLTAVSPLDGRYSEKVNELRFFLSEYGLIRYRVLVEVLEFFHFACTSEDINNLAHGLMLRDAVNLVMLPIMDELIYVMCDMAAKTSNISMLSRTHGQAASPTTLGKELAVFSFRLNSQKKLISQVKLLGKFAGAVGNYNAHLVAYPNIDWPRIAEEFVESLGISFNPYVTQVSI